MAHLSDDVRATAMAKLDRAADRCLATVTGKAKVKGHGAAKLKLKLRVCLKSAF
jgi:hypothetical protein